MKIAEYTVNNLVPVICGENRPFIYQTGNQLMHLFNKYGYNDIEIAEFGSRGSYVREKIRELNGTDTLKQIIEDIVDPRRYVNMNENHNYETAAQKLNEIIGFDKYELKKVDGEYRVHDLNGLIVNPETTQGISHDFIKEQIKKCFDKISANDFNGAITNARSLLEALFIEIIEKHDNTEVKNDGNLDGLWSRVKKILKMELDRDHMPDYVIQILSGIDTTIKGFAGLSNNAGDRHATKFRTRKHHAKLAVNLTMSITDFLLDSWNFQTEKVSNLTAVVTG